MNETKEVTFSLRPEDAGDMYFDIEAIVAARYPNFLDWDYWLDSEVVWVTVLVSNS